MRVAARAVLGVNLHAVVLDGIRAEHRAAHLGNVVIVHRADIGPEHLHQVVLRVRAACGRPRIALVDQGSNLVVPRDHAALGLERLRHPVLIPAVGQHVLAQLRLGQELADEEAARPLQVRRAGGPVDVLAQLARAPHRPVVGHVGPGDFRLPARAQGAHDLARLFLAGHAELLRGDLHRRVFKRRVQHHLHQLRAVGKVRELLKAELGALVSDLPLPADLPRGHAVGQHVVRHQLPLAHQLAPALLAEVVHQLRHLPGLGLVREVLRDGLYLGARPGRAQHGFQVLDDAVHQRDARVRGVLPRQAILAHVGAVLAAVGGLAVPAHEARLVRAVLPPLVVEVTAGLLVFLEQEVEVGFGNGLEQFVRPAIGLVSVHGASMN